MGCKPSSQQATEVAPDSHGPPGNQNKNNCSPQNHSLSTGFSWRKKEKPHLSKDSAENTLNESNCAATLSAKTSLKVLLVFPKEDAVAEAFAAAVASLGYDCAMERTAEGALSSYDKVGHDISVLDLRHPKIIDGVDLCRKMRNSKWSRNSVLIATVRKSYYEDSSCQPLLNAGFTRVMLETLSQRVLANELLQVQVDVMWRTSVCNAHSLYTALSECRQLVQITDENFQVQYVNKATENQLGFRPEDLRGKSIKELHIGPAVYEAIAQQLKVGKEWSGPFTYRRRSGESLQIPCRVFKSSVNNSSNITNYIFIEDNSGSMESSVVSKDQPPRGSLHSIRKGSYDVKSLASESGQSLRRQSLAKLNSLPIEAPITKIITLLYSAHEQSSPSIQAQLDKVVDILRSTELYSPQLKENRLRPDDPVTVDLISALLSQASVPISTTRRSSNDSANVKGSAGSRPSLPSINAPGQITSVLEHSLDWAFDIFKLEDLSNLRPLYWLGMNLMCHFNVHNTLGCEEKTMMNWLTVVEMHYHSTNPYHNSTHAADVMQASACYLKKQRLKDILDPLDEACSLIAACCHDIDHPGKSSIFLVHSDHELAILYNDVCVLESHHAAITFKLTTADDRVNIFKGLERDTYKVARQSIIDMILATEMTKHYEHLAKFVNTFPKPEPKEEDALSGEGEIIEIELLTRENVALVKRMLIKCADVSNPTRPLKLCAEWARRIAEEYFNQTDEEKASGLPVVMPMFDRSNCCIPKSQIGFIDFIINDMMEAWDSFIELPEILYHLRNNYQFWKEKEEEGVNSVADLFPSKKIEELHEVDESKSD